MIKYDLLLHQTDTHTHSVTREKLEAEEPAIVLRCLSHQVYHIVSYIVLLYSSCVALYCTVVAHSFFLLSYQLFFWGFSIHPILVNVILQPNFLQFGTWTQIGGQR